MDSIILYSTGCPRCKTLKKLLLKNNISYTEVNDVDEMIQKGFTEVPVLEINGQQLDYESAVNWIMNTVNSQS